MDRIIDVKLTKPRPAMNVYRDIEGQYLNLHEFMNKSRHKVGDVTISARCGMIISGYLNRLDDLCKELKRSMESEGVDDYQQPRLENAISEIQSFIDVERSAIAISKMNRNAYYGGTM